MDALKFFIRNLMIRYFRSHSKLTFSLIINFNPMNIGFTLLNIRIKRYFTYRNNNLVF